MKKPETEVVATIKGVNITTKDAQRFWTKVDKRGEDECWEWGGRKNNKGYGVMTIGRESAYAHRLSYTLIIGSVPNGLFILHSCDNPLCVNTSHLRIGTQKDNMMDRSLRGRANMSRGDDHYTRKNPEKAPSGERNGNAKLTARIVLDIRERHFSKGASQKSLAQEFRVSKALLCGIINRKIWKHI